MFYKLLFISLFLSSCIWGNSFCHQINSYSDFEQYSKTIDTERFTKCVLDLHQNTLYYFDVNTYMMHLDFISKELTSSPFSYDEYIRNYEEIKPNYIFCYLVHHEKQDIWTFALWEGDKATKQDIEKCYSFLSKSFYKKDELQFRPTSTYQEKIAKTLTDICVVTNDELFRNSDYQVLHAGSSVGVLRISNNDPIIYEYQSDEIVILPVAIPDITPVSGIITEQFSTPLSHLALRARSWQIPHAAIKDASNTYKELAGKWVFFKASSSGYELRLATACEIETHVNSIKPPDQVVLAKANLTEQKLKPLNQLRRAHHVSYGTKAANLGECTQLHTRIPEGFAIPFYYYDRHIKACGAYELLQQSDYILDEIRQKILTYPLEKSLLEAVWKLLPQNGAFIRSSTNAEDLAGFNGAGLYDTVANVKTLESLENAIKTVWASVWNSKAFKERMRYGIDHKSVYSAVLVQPSICATSAGVLVTKDIFDPTEEMEVYTINASRGLGLRVVDGAMIPEQITYNFGNKGIKIVSRASAGPIIICDELGGTKEIEDPSRSEPVLTDEQVHMLGRATNQIRRLFRAEYTLDIEWLFQNNTLYIVQVRPFS